MKSLLKIKLKNNEVIMLCLVILTLFAAFNILWKKSGSANALNEIRAKADASKKVLADNQALYDKLSKRSPASEGFSADYMSQYAMLNDRFSSVITGIVNSSKSKKFTLSRLSLENQSAENGYKKMLYSLDAEASFIEIGKFLEKLEDAPLLTEVSSVEINRIDNEMKRCKAHIKLYSYVRAE